MGMINRTEAAAKEIWSNKEKSCIGILLIKKQKKTFSTFPIRRSALCKGFNTTTTDVFALHRPGAPYGSGSEKREYVRLERPNTTQTNLFALQTRGATSTATTT